MITAINVRRQIKRFTQYLQSNSSRSSKKKEVAKNVFNNIRKQIPPESYKRFKIDYDQSNNIGISELKNESDDDVSF